MELYPYSLQGLWHHCVWTNIFHFNLSAFGCCLFPWPKWPLGAGSMTISNDGQWTLLLNSMNRYCLPGNRGKTSTKMEMRLKLERDTLCYHHYSNEVTERNLGPFGNIRKFHHHLLLLIALRSLLQNQNDYDWLSLVLQASRWHYWSCTYDISLREVFIIHILGRLNLRLTILGLAQCY